MDFKEESKRLAKILIDYQILGGLNSEYAVTKAFSDELVDDMAETFNAILTKMKEK